MQQPDEHDDDYWQRMDSRVAEGGRALREDAAAALQDVEATVRGVATHYTVERVPPDRVDLLGHADWDDAEVLDVLPAPDVRKANAAYWAAVRDAAPGWAVRLAVRHSVEVTQTWVLGIQVAESPPLPAPMTLAREHLQRASEALRDAADCIEESVTVLDPYGARGAEQERAEAAVEARVIRTLAARLAERTGTWV